MERNNKNCKKAYKEKQYCEHIPDKIKSRMYDMEKFTKYNEGKPMDSLMPAGIMDGTLHVLGFGCSKYEKDNWKKCNEMSTWYDGCKRHLNLFWSGEDLDKESQLSHIDHALCNLVFLKWQILNKGESDDRGQNRKINLECGQKKRKRVSFPLRWRTFFRNKNNKT